MLATSSLFRWRGHKAQHYIAVMGGQVARWVDGIDSMQPDQPLQIDLEHQQADRLAGQLQVHAAG